MTEYSPLIKNRPHVIFILGAGGSGSSLLAALLHQHENIVSAGELSVLDTYVALDRPCSCGELISECSFWQNISLESSYYSYGTPITPSFRENQLLLHRRSVLRKDPLFLPVTRKNLDIYKQIQTLSRKNVIVDASKDLARYYYLFNSGCIRITPILLVRDGRSYIASMRSRKTMGAIRSTVRWGRKNLLSRMVLNKTLGRNGYLLIDFDKFISDPDSTLKNITDHINLPPLAATDTEITTPHHGLAGTSVRKGVFMKDLQPQTLDKNVTNNRELKLFEKIVFWVLGGYFLNRLIRSK